MDKTKLAIVWGFLVVLLVFGVVLGMQVGSLELKAVDVGDITQLLATSCACALCRAHARSLHYGVAR